MSVFGESHDYPFIVSSEATVWPKLRGGKGSS